MQHLAPRAAYAFLQQRTDAVLVDCRTETEHMYVGHPVGAEHVAWQEGLDWEIDPAFADKVKRLVKGDLNRPVLLICRSGRRSVEAAVLKAQPLPYRGFESVFSRNLTINFRAEDR